MTTRAKSFVALLLSALLPGLGQIYNDEKKKGWVILACCVALAIATYWLGDFNAITAALALLLLWSSAIIDAYKVAKDIRLPKKPLIRNRDIVRETAVLIATPEQTIEQLRSGTWATVRYARKMNRPTVLIFPDGTLTLERP